MTAPAPARTGRGVIEAEGYTIETAWLRSARLFRASVRTREGRPFTMYDQSYDRLVRAAQVAGAALARRERSAA